jgi:ArsR family transcriptional regulator
MNPTSFFKALADETRLRCLVLIIAEGALCVCEFCHAMSLSQPKISRHLATLRRLEIVKDERQGLWVFYKLHPGLPAWMRMALEQAARGLVAEKWFLADRRRLAGMKGRPTRTAAA